MEIEVRENPRKAVFYWMSAEEAQNKELMASLEPQFNEWKAKNYQPIIFESGSGKLEDSLYLLMKQNYEKLAKKQLEEEAGFPEFTMQM